MWTLLYIVMGFASWRVYHRGEGFLGKARHTLLIYIAKLFLNWMWPLIAYGLESLLGATIAIGILLTFVIFTGFLFFRIDKLAGFMFIPYIAYSSYATVLCIHIYFLNQWGLNKIKNNQQLSTRFLNHFDVLNSVLFGLFINDVFVKWEV